MPNAVQTSVLPYLSSPFSTFPLRSSSFSPKEEEPKHAPASEASARAGTISVLVIDDDVALVRMVRFNLLSQGMNVSTAANGPQGLERVTEVQPDVIVLDLQMPGMNGREVFREMRARGNKTPVIIFSAFEAEAARRELGAEGALEKPFNPEVLLRLVQRLATESGG